MRRIQDSSVVFLIFMALELLVESTSSGETDEARLSPGNPNGADLRQHAQRPNVQIGGRRTKALAHYLHIYSYSICLSQSSVPRGQYAGDTP
jgi:hypothetical protein